MRLILVRHGETDWNLQSRVQGQSDVELNEVGREQASALALRLKEERFDTLYTSPLKRALETAQAINRFHDVKVIIEDGLKEMNVGELDGLVIAEIKNRYASFWQRWIGDSCASVIFPQGESLQQLQGRVWATVQRIKERHRHGTVVAVSHYFAIMGIICMAIKLDISQFRRFYPLDAAAISILDFAESGAVLRLFNDTCHLVKET
jgi:broad specificity phosphatase PhoE